MDELLLSTVVYVPPEEAYAFVEDFPGYARYSEYLQAVTPHGDGGPGTEYDIRVRWWKLSYTVRTRVVDASPPESIDWEVIENLRARGRWRIEDAPEEAPDENSEASRVWLEIRFDPDSANARSLDLPRFVSLGWVVKKVRPLVQREAETVVERIVADLEGERRPVELTIHD